jgi:F420-dependent oxidoreductase-like protein
MEDQRRVWRIADEAGFDHLWLFDHFNPIFGSDLSGPIYEGWTLLAAMAEATRRVRVGVMVTGNTYRHPGVLAKMGVTVDHISNGRLEFGLGASWAEAEHTMLGLEFPTVGERIRRLNEALVVIKKLWTEEAANHEGRAYRLTEARANPKPLQKPHPPIWVGGGGERKTLRVVARHADFWNAAGGLVDDLKRKSHILDQHCVDVGRDPATIRRSVQVRFNPSEPDSTEREMEELIEAGFPELIVIVTPPNPEVAAEVVATRLLPRFRGAEHPA